MQIVPIAIFLTICTTYIVATQLNEVKPYPNCTITDTATPYPQNILFRYVMFFIGPIIALFWATIYYIIVGNTQRLGANISISSVIIFFGIFGVFCFEMAIATIDSLHMADTLHGASAVIFIVLWTFNMWLIDDALTAQHKIDPNIISWKSLLVKKLLTWALSLIWIVEIIGLIFP